jgi:dTDP-4-dehydrorhamnose 3,5-epimerase
VRFESTGIDDVVLIRLDLHQDDRGAFARTFCPAEMAEAGLLFSVAQANLSQNIRTHTLRGLHYQHAPHGEAKIVSCVRGRIWDVAVDMREGSPTYRKWYAAELSPESGSALYIGEGLAHGFLTLEPHSDVHYLMGTPFAPSAAEGVRWNDPAIAIRWPENPAVISDKDANFALLG